MGSLCFCYSSKQMENQNRYFQILCTKQSYRQELKKQAENKNSIKIELRKKEHRQNRLPYNQKTESSVLRADNQRVIQQYLKRNEQKQCLQLQYQQSLVEQIRKQIISFYDEEKTKTIFIDQPMVSQQVDIKKIYREVIKGIESAEGYFQLKYRYRDSQSLDKSVDSQKRKKKDLLLSQSTNRPHGKIKAVVFWELDGRINQDDCKKIVRDVCRN